MKCWQGEGGGGICYIKVEKNRRNNRALRNAGVDNFGRGIGVFVGTVGHPAMQVAG